MLYSSVTKYLHLQSNLLLTFSPTFLLCKYFKCLLKRFQFFSSQCQVHDQYFSSRSCWLFSGTVERRRMLESVSGKERSTPALTSFAKRSPIRARAMANAKSCAKLTFSMSQSSTSGIDQITFESTEVGVDGVTANHNLYSTTNHTSHQISERERPHVYYMILIQ